MSKIKNGGLDQYDKVQSLNGIGGERVKGSIRTREISVSFAGDSRTEESSADRLCRGCEVTAGWCDA